MVRVEELFPSDSAKATSSLHSRSKRIEWVDCAKGLCTFFVILMHLDKPKIYSQICVPIFLCTFFLYPAIFLRVHTKILNQQKDY